MNNRNMIYFVNNTTGVCSTRNWWDAISICFLAVFSKYTCTSNTHYIILIHFKAIQCHSGESQWAVNIENNFLHKIRSSASCWHTIILKINHYISVKKSLPPQLTFISSSSFLSLVVSPTVSGWGCIFDSTSISHSIMWLMSSNFSGGLRWALGSSSNDWRVT